MTAEQAALVERLRSLLAAEPTVREVSMFGGRSIMVNDKMVVAAQRDGALLVRVAADRHEELLAKPGAAQAEMGAGRDMGPGWIEVAPAVIAEDDGLAFWVAAARMPMTGARMVAQALPSGAKPTENTDTSQMPCRAIAQMREPVTRRTM